MAFTKILPAGISTTGLVTVDSLSVGDVTLTGDTDNLIINTDTVTVRPTLDLNFARDKRLDSKITFTRNSVGTYVDANGLIQTAVNNIPRFDHDPITGESLGLLIEESRTNLQYPSIPTVSSSAVTVTANAAVAPDGTSTATFCEPNNIGSGVRSNPATISKSVGQFYTHTFFFKPSGYNVAGIDYGSGIPDSYAEAWINVTNNQSYVGNTFNSITSTPLSNGWYKITAVQEIASAGNTPNWGKALSCRPDIPTGNNQSYTRVSGSGGFFWGHQEELGSFPTSYIPTSGSTVTRAVDEATITGTNFTDWYNASEGSIFAKYSAGTNVSEVPFAITKTGSESAYVIAIAASSSGPDIGVVPTIVVADGGVTQTGITVPITPVNGDVIRTAIGYKENDFVIYSAADTESGFASDSSGTIPTVDIARIGKYPYYGIWQNRPIARILYYPERLSNAQLQNLTK